MSEQKLTTNIIVEGSTSDEVTCLLCQKKLELQAPGQVVCPNDSCIITAQGTLFAATYLLKETLGTGGWGTVFKCEHIHLKKVLAIKILHQHMAQDRECLLRFQREARILNTISHKNLLASILQPQPFIAMEYLDGVTLDTIASTQVPLSVDKALPIFKQICQALNAAHQVNVIHRDLKPANVFLTGDPRQPTVKVLDFGIARVSETTLTQTGQTLGSPAYMSPEQCLGQQLDQRTDIYSMGCLMYEVLTGRSPFEADSALEFVRKHVMEMPLAMTQANATAAVPADLQEIVFTCLAKEPEARYESAAALELALEKVNPYATPTRDVPKSDNAKVIWGALQAPLLMATVSLAIVSDDLLIRSAAALLALLVMTGAALYWLYCVFALKKAIEQDGFKLEFSPIASALLMFLASCTSIIGAALNNFLSLFVPVYVSCPLIISGCLVLFLLPLIDFHNFLAQRQGRREVGPALLYIIGIATLGALAPLTMFYIPNENSLLLPLGFAFVFWSASFALLHMLALSIKTQINGALPAPAKHHQQLIPTGLFLLLLTGVFIACQPGFISLDQSLLSFLKTTAISSTGAQVK